MAMKDNDKPYGGQQSLSAGPAPQASASPGLAAQFGVGGAIAGAMGMGQGGGQAAGGGSSGGYQSGGGGGTSNTGGNFLEGLGNYFGVGRPTTIGHYDSPQANRDDYYLGGSAEGFQKLVDASNQRADAYGNRSVAFDPSRANQSLDAAGALRTNEAALTNMLERQARGEGPSVAEATYRKAADDATRRAQGLATSARGGQGLLGSRRAAEVGYEGAQDAATNAGMIRTNEMIAARGQLGQQLAQRNASELARGGLGLDVSRTGTELGQRQMSINDAAQQGEYNRGLQMQQLNQAGGMGYNAQQSGNDLATNQLNLDVDKTNLQQINNQNAKRGGLFKKALDVVGLDWLPAMPFTHATPRADGGVDFVDASTGQKQTLYGQTALSYAQKLPSMATSPEALAAASGAEGGGSGPPTPPPVATDAAPPVDPNTGAIGSSGANPYPNEDPNANRSGAASVAPPPGWKDPGASGEGGATGSSGKSIGVGDVGGVSGAGGGNPYNTLSTTLKLAAVDDILKGAGGHKAGFVPGTETTQRKGQASEETVKAIQDALDRSGEAAGGKAEVARQSDQAQQATYREAAQRSLESVQAIDKAQRAEADVFAKRAARLEQEAADQDRNAPGLKGLLNRLRNPGTTGDEGDALIMAANTGGNVADIMRAKQAARAAKGNPRDEADKALVESAKAIRVGELAKTEAYTNYLTHVLKGQEAEYKALGREPELRAQLADLERRKAEIRGEREAALQGDVTSTRKWREASSGTGAAAKLRAAEILSSLSGAQSGPSVLVGEMRVPVDPKLPEAARNELYKQTDAQALAEASLKSAMKYHKELTATDIASYKAGVTTGPMAKYLGAVAERAAHTSVARGMGAQQDAERKDNEGRYLAIWGAEAHMERELESDQQNRIRLMRKATGRDPIK